MIYDFNRIIDREGTAAIKLAGLQEHWGRTDLIPLWVADMDFRAAEVRLEVVAQIKAVPQVASNKNITIK